MSNYVLAYIISSLKFLFLCTVLPVPRRRVRRVGRSAHQLAGIKAQGLGFVSGKILVFFGYILCTRYVNYVHGLIQKIVHVEELVSNLTFLSIKIIIL